MRVDDGGKLRSQPPDFPGPRAAPDFPPRGEPATFYPRLCLCPKCGSEGTGRRGSSKGFYYMACRRCGLEFKARRA